MPRAFNAPRLAACRCAPRFGCWWCTSLLGGATVIQHISTSTSDAAGWADSAQYGFESTEGLGALLIRLHKAGSGA